MAGENIYQDIAEELYIQIFDGRTATEATETGDKYPYLKTIQIHEQMPAFGDAIKTRDPELVIFRNKIYCYKVGVEALEGKEMTISIPILENDVATSKHVWEQFFNQHLTDDTYGLADSSAVVSTNDGSVTARNLSTWATDSTGMPTTEKMIGVHFFFNGSVAAKQFGKRFNYVQVRDFIFEIKDGIEYCTVTLMNHGVGIDTTELMTQTTV